MLCSIGASPRSKLSDQCDFTWPIAMTILSGCKSKRSGKFETPQRQPERIPRGSDTQRAGSLYIEFLCSSNFTVNLQCDMVKVKTNFSCVIHPVARILDEQKHPTKKIAEDDIARYADNEEIIKLLGIGTDPVPTLRKWNERAEILFDINAAGKRKTSKKKKIAAHMDGSRSSHIYLLYAFRCL